jgi:hypothetical protein
MRFIWKFVISSCILKDITLKDNLFTTFFQIWFNTTMCMKMDKEKSFFFNIWLQMKKIVFDQYLWIKGHSPK